MLTPLPDVLADCIALVFGSPPTGSLRETIASMLEKRLNDARELFIKELEQGGRSPYQVSGISAYGTEFGC